MLSYLIVYQQEYAAVGKNGQKTLVSKLYCMVSQNCSDKVLTILKKNNLN